MSAFIHKVFSFLKKYPGACVLFIVLLCISLATIKPGYYVLGWDNYSSYFNLGTNIFRTLFSTWRSYRGLGVPADSEVTDLFRQLFAYLLHFFVAEKVIDQLYIVMCLWIGVYAAYGFGKKLLAHNHLSRRVVESGATVLALFYVFNLNTLSMFYFPIITYITRFAAIPLIFLMSYQFLYKPHLSRRYLFLFVPAFWFISGSFITGTVFITTVLSLFVFLLFQPKKKRSLLVFLFFVGVNCFWLLPFANYTKEKSTIIRLAPTFIDANESQLNKGKTFYEPFKQFVLYPNFFETQYQLINTQQQEPFHPLATEINRTPIQLSLFIFPALYIIGSLIIILRWKKHRSLLWVPLLIFGYLFLSFKEYSPLGFVYHWLDTYLPYFGVLFRFGDTKFHPYIAFSGSVAAGVCVMTFLSGWRKFLPTSVKFLSIIPLATLVMISVFPFWRYTTEGMLGFFMYVDLPPAYQEIASIINTDPQPGRVLHLPFDRDQYWKSYSWGGLGSAFFQYMLDKPLVDKTFEPASMENAYLHKRLSELTWGIQLLPVDTQQKRAEELYSLFTKTGISYLVIDESVSSYIPSRGIIFGGNYNTRDVETAMDILTKQGKIQEKKTSEISSTHYPQSLRREDIEDTTNRSLRLYTLSAPATVSFQPDSIAVDSQFQNILEHENLQTKTVEQFQSKKPSQLYPFMRDDGQLVTNEKSLLYSLPISPISGEGIRKVSVADGSRKIISVSLKEEGPDLVFQYYWVYLPTINGVANRLKIGETRIPAKTFGTLADVSSAYALSDWQGLGLPYNAGYRLVINSIVLPFSLPHSQQEVDLGSVVVADTNFDVSFLEKTQSKSIDINTIHLTDQPNCFSDASSNYSNGMQRTLSGLRISSENGSTCFWTDLSPYVETSTYAELRTLISGSSENTDQQNQTQFPDSGKPLLRSTVMDQSKINTFRICISQGQGGDCFNKHQLLNLPTNETEVLVPFDRLIRSHDQLSVVFALKPVGYQSQAVTFSSVNLDQYKTVKEESISFSSKVPEIQLQPLSKTLELEFPIALSDHGFVSSSGDDLPYVSNKPCESKPGFRTFAKLEGFLLSYVENCYNEMYSELSFDNTSFLLWGIQYDLHSGKYPKMMVQDKLLRYKDKYASVYQGYPDVHGFKDLQTPEYFFTSKENILTTLKQSPVVTSSLLIAPDVGEGDTRKKQFSILSHAENEGVISVGKNIIAELPDAWRKFSITSEEAESSFAVPDSVSIQTILPSFRVVKLVIPDEQKQYLLRFDEAYDRQWQLVGKGIQLIDHTRCDGYANCFEFYSKDPQQVYRLYLIYIPEIVSFFGWGITLITAVLIPFIFSRKG